MAKATPNTGAKSTMRNATQDQGEPVSLTRKEQHEMDECVRRAAGSWLMQAIIKKVCEHHGLNIDPKTVNPHSPPDELKDALSDTFSGKSDPAEERRIIVQILQGMEEKFKERIIGQDELMLMLMISLVLNEHALLEGLPGVGKTEIVKWIAAVCGLPFSRVQFIPDMLPSDLIGKDHVDILLLERKDKDAVKWRNGPIFGSIVLADEITRAPSKVQAALLEAMGERQVTPFGKLSQPVLSPLHEAALLHWNRESGLLGANRPIQVDPDSLKDIAQFTVVATMNPIEQEGTYPLSEAQTDRFCFKVVVPYPSLKHYKAISHVVHHHGSIRPIETKLPVEKCEAYFSKNPDSMIFILTPLYFFLKCRAHVLPLSMNEEPLFPEVQGASLFEYMETLGRQELEHDLLRDIYDVVYMTNARGGQSGEGATAAGWYDREQLDMRSYIASLKDQDPEDRRKAKLREILQQSHCRYVKAGASPRGFLKLIPAVLCHSLVHGDPPHLNEGDIRAVIDNVLRHRVHMDVHARLGGVTAEDVIQRVCQIILSE